MNERAIFDAALDVSDPVERAAYLDRACQGDRLLRLRVGSLLDAMPRLEMFLEGSPAFARCEAYAGEQPGDDIGPYRLLEVIGEGGFGVVFLAEQLRPLRRRVALKVIKSEYSGREIIARFEAERQALALMEHPHIARVLDGGATSGGRPYFVMELARGEAITDHCDRLNLSIRERAALFVPVCRAIQHAHQKGVIHRDIKPGNILVTYRDGEPTPKVIDFGVAKAIDARLDDCGGGNVVQTRRGQLVGTLEYMSPEQAEMGGHELDTRSDVYSLGVVLYELLTGKTPLSIERRPDTTFDEILRAIRQSEPAPPSVSVARDEGELASRRGGTPRRIARSLRGDLDRIALQALHKSRHRRYASAGELADDLERFLQGEVVLAGKPPWGHRFRRRMRPWESQLVWAAALAIVAAVALATVQWRGTPNASTNEQPAKADPKSIASAENQEAAIEKGRTLLERGDWRTGLLWLAKARDSLPADDKTRRPSIELAMSAAWSELPLPAVLAPQAGEHEVLGGGRKVTWLDRDDSGRLLGCVMVDRRTHIFVSSALGETISPAAVIDGNLRERSLAWGREGTFLAIANGVELQRWQTGGKELGAPIVLDSAGRSQVFVCPQRQRLLIFASDLKTARLVDLESGRELRSFAASDGAMFRSPGAGASPFSPVGERFVLVEIGAATTLSRYLASTGERIGKPTLLDIPAHLKFGDGYAVGPAATTILAELHTATPSIARDGASSLQEFETASGQAIGEPWKAVTARPSEAPKSLAISHDGSLAAILRDDLSASGDRVDIWRLGARSRQITTFGGRGRIARMRFDEEGRLWIFGDSEVVAWSLPQPKERQLLLPHAAAVELVSVSSDGRWIMTLAGGRATRWRYEDVVDGALGERPPTVIELPQAVGGARPAVAFHTSGNSLVVASGNRAIEYGFDDGRPLGDPIVATYSIRELAFDRDGERLLCVSSLDQTSGEIAVYDFTSRRPIGRPFRSLCVFAPSANHAGISQGAAAISPDGQRILSTDRLWRARLTALDPSSARSLETEPATVAFGLDDRLTHARFLSGDRVLGCIHGLSLDIRHASNGAPAAARIELSSPLTALAQTKDGRIIAVATGSGVQRWEIATGRPIGPMIPCGNVTALSFAAGDAMLLAGDGAGLVRAWQVVDDLPLERLRSAAIEAATGWTLAESGRAAPLGGDRWRSRIEAFLAALPTNLRPESWQTTFRPADGPPHFVREWHKNLAKDAFLSGDRELALARLAEIPEEAVDARVCLMRAKVLVSLERHDEAAVAIRSALERGASDAAILCRAGHLWMEQDQWREALACWDRAVALGERGPHALTQRATCRAELGEWKESLDDLKAVAAANPFDAEAAERLAVALVSAGEIGEYRKLCREILSRMDLADYGKRPWTAPASLSLAPDGLDDYAPILEPARAFAAKFSDDCVTYHVLAPFGYRAGSYDEAAKAKPAPGSMQAIHLEEVIFRAMAQAQLGNREEAEEELKSLARLDWRGQDVWARQRMELLLDEAKTLLDITKIDSLFRQGDQ